MRCNNYIMSGYRSIDYQLNKIEKNLYNALINKNNARVFCETARNKKKNEILAQYADGYTTNNLGSITETLLYYGNGVSEATTDEKYEFEIKTNVNEIFNSNNNNANFVGPNTFDPSINNVEFGFSIDCNLNDVILTVYDNDVNINSVNFTDMINNMIA